MFVKRCFVARDKVSCRLPLLTMRFDKVEWQQLMCLFACGWACSVARLPSYLAEQVLMLVRALLLLLP